MKRIFTLLLLFSVHVHASENLNKDDYPGTWYSGWVAVQGEKQTLVININKDDSSSFKRVMPDGKPITLTSKSINRIEDIVIIYYSDSDGSLVYKLALSGWRSNNSKMIYGTMFMYNKGKQYNGLPVSFKQ
jgi:hypothetical protein